MKEDEHSPTRIEGNACCREGSAFSEARGKNGLGNCGRESGSNTLHAGSDASSSGGKAY